MMSHGNGSYFLTKKARRLALVPKFAHRDGPEVTANEFYSNWQKKKSDIVLSKFRETASVVGL